jgi:protein-tyrosine phosphatase
MKKILFVCLGNICRSPLADGIMRKKIKERGLNWQVDSAGTGNWHINEAPDPRAQAIAEKYGYNISNLKARQFQLSDFEEFDHIFAMDHQNYQDIKSLQPSTEQLEKLELFLNRLNPGLNQGVRDPWFDDALFEPVLLEIEACCDKILNDLHN